MKSLVTALGMVGFLVVACSGDDDGPKVGNGVNNVRAACDLRVGWNRTSESCSLCEAGVVSPVCDCEALKAFSGACLDQQNVWKSACSDQVNVCVSSCRQSDCDCIDACYANDEACRKAADARDGCIAEACPAECK